MNINIPKLSLVVLVGPSGSGKSTFARRHFRPTEILSSDSCRAMVSDDENDQSVTKDAFEVLRFVAGKRLALGRLTVIDATNVQPEARRPLVELARREGWPVLASNAPRHYASAISAAGLGALSIVEPANRHLLAADLDCPRDEYYRRFVDALRSDDLPAAGALMAASHASLAEDFEVSTPRLDALVADLSSRPGVFGARLTGAGFGGCVVALCRAGAVRDGWSLVPSAGAHVIGR